MAVVCSGYYDDMANEPNSNEQLEPRKHSLFARIMVGFGFSAVGAKLGLLGTVADLNAVVGKDLTLSQKFRGVFSKEILGKLSDKMEHLLGEGKSLPRAMTSVTKWTMIVTGVGAIGGLVVGWMRGGLIENWKDPFTHPIRSTKIIFGFEKPPASSPKVQEPAKVMAVTEEPKPVTDKWVDKVQARASHAAAVTQDKASQTEVSLG